MCRVLLVDEELSVLKQIQSIIKSEYAKECKVYYAQSGREAVEKADTLKPDIIFLDIHLPGLNGLQVMQEIRSFDYHAIFIVVTDCQSFDYAKEAMDQQVMDYLLKPVKAQVVLNAMTHAIEKVHKSRKNYIQNKQIYEKLDTVVPMIEGEFVKAMTLQANLMSNVNAYREILNIQERYGFVMIFQFERIKQENLIREKNIADNITEEEYDAIKKIIKESFPAVIGNRVNEKIVSFVPWNQLDYKEKSSQSYRNKASHILEKMPFTDEKICKLGVGELHSLERCGESYSEALEELEQKDRNSSEVCLGNRSTEKLCTMELEKKLVNVMRICDMDGIHRISKKLFEQTALSVENNIEEMKINVLGIIMLAENELLSDGKQTNSFCFRTEYLKELQLKETKEQLYEWLLEKLLSICCCIENDSGEKNTQIIHVTKNYIEHNYCDNISLEAAAEQVKVSPYYLSKLFKASTGKNFIDYVTRLRIEKAKILLKQKKMSVDEISIQCGYKNPAYFSRVFKKRMKMTPSTYRKNILDS